MLNEKKITIISKSVIDEVEVAQYSAILDATSGELSFYTRQIDKPMCKLHKETVRADLAEFEDFAYAVQDSIKPVSVESND